MLYKQQKVPIRTENCGFIHHTNQTYIMSLIYFFTLCVLVVYNVYIEEKLNSVCL